MSLKSFHILFITISSLFTIFFGYWCYSEWSAYDDSKYLFFTCISIILSISLIIYGKLFLKKINNLDVK